MKKSVMLMLGGCFYWDMRYIVDNFIKNGDVKLENVQRWVIRDWHMGSSDHFVDIL